MRFKQIPRSLSRLLGATSETSAEAPDRIEALESASQAQVLAAALEAADESLRAAAIEKLEDGEALRVLAGLRPETADELPMGLERVAQERLARLVDAGTIEFETLRVPPVQLTALLAVAGFSNDPRHLSGMLDSIDAAERQSLILGGASSRIRQMAAQTVSEPAELRALLKLLQGKDKNVYKIIREKCDALNADEQALERARADAIRACESLERHAHRTYEPVYEPTLRHFRTRWEALESHAGPDVRARAARAIEGCAGIVADHHRRVGEELAEAEARAAREAEREEARRRIELESANAREQAEREAAEAAERRAAEDRASAELAATQAAVMREVHALIGKAQGALKEGATGRASGLRRALDEKLAALATVPAPIARQVQKLDASLEELKAWKEHAAAPKRAELIQAMEALAGEKMKPQARAERIRELQEDWKTVSKGVLSDTDADWQRFHQAAERAYEPCRQHFEAQAKGRQTNAEKRAAILERLRAFETAQSGDDPDWRAFGVVLREAPLEWRRYFPVERAAARTLQKEFDEVIGRLKERLATWQAANAEQKQLLIRRAAGLVDLQDGREAAEGAKQLQAKWKDLGAAGPEQDQALWAEFRKHCDAVFQKRHQAHVEYNAELQSNKARAAALCEEAERFAAGAAADLREAGAKANEWRAAFESLGELPRNEERALKGRLERTIERVKQLLSEQRSRDRQRSVEDLLEAAGRIHAYARATGEAAPEAERAALKQAAESFIGGISQWPKGGLEALADARARADRQGAPDPADEKAARLLCIRAEILRELPTPPQDQALRREFQMQRLVERMGRGGDGASDSAESLWLEWVRGGALPREVHEELLGRMRAALGPG